MNLFHLWVHFLDEVVFALGERFNAASLFLQLIEHRALSFGNAVHPKKTDYPAACANAGEGRQKNFIRQPSH